MNVKVKSVTAWGMKWSGSECTSLVENLAFHHCGCTWWGSPVTAVHCSLTGFIHHPCIQSTRQGPLYLPPLFSFFFTNFLLHSRHFPLFPSSFNLKPRIKISLPSFLSLLVAQTLFGTEECEHKSRLECEILADTQYPQTTMATQHCSPASIINNKKTLAAN